MIRRLLTALLVVALPLAAHGQAARPSKADSARIDSLLARADAGRIQGSPTAPVWLVEISDFQCPFCKRWHDEIYPAIKRDYVDKGIVRMAYLHFPLSIHPHAPAAAIASLCAAEQSKFWSLHDKLFDTQNRWAPMTNAVAYFDSLALASGVNATAYRRCMQEGHVRRVMGADVSRARAAQIQSTPTFFVGDEPIVGVAPLADFRAAIERQRAKAGKPSR